MARRDEIHFQDDVGNSSSVLGFDAMEKYFYVKLREEVSDLTAQNVRTSYLK